MSPRAQQRPSVHSKDSSEEAVCIFDESHMSLAALPRTRRAGSLFAPKMMSFAAEKMRLLLIL